MATARVVWFRVVSLAVLLLFLAAPTAGGLSAADAGDQAGLVGNETCGFCHEDAVAAVRPSIHWRVDPEGSCEGCHGPGESHVEEADPEKIRRFDSETPVLQRRSACLACHERNRSQGDYPKSDHGLAGMACDACHSIHAPASAPSLQAETPGMCYECHASVRAQFALSEHHPVEEGGIACTDCHDPHRPARRSLLAGFKQDACLECHTEYRGPWFFEHEAVTVEGCTACHTPHGSVNRHLLTYQRVGDLCMQCHPEQPFFHDATDDTGDRTTGINDCTRCHEQIHGSNNDALFLN